MRKPRASSLRRQWALLAFQPLGLWDDYIILCHPAHHPFRLKNLLQGFESQDYITLWQSVPLYASISSSTVSRARSTWRHTPEDLLPGKAWSFTVLSIPPNKIHKCQCLGQSSKDWKGTYVYANLQPISIWLQDLKIILMTWNTNTDLWK